MKTKIFTLLMTTFVLGVGSQAFATPIPFAKSMTKEITQAAHLNDLFDCIQDESEAIEKGDTKVSPSHYEYIYECGDAFHCHLYDDSLIVITQATGSESGEQVLFIYGTPIASKTIHDKTKRIDGVKYKVYKYPGITVYHAGEKQFIRM